MSDTRPNGLPQSMVFPRHEKPTTSWWLSQGTREAFMDAHKRELARMTQARITTSGERRTIDSRFGKI